MSGSGNHSERPDEVSRRVSEPLKRSVGWDERPEQSNKDKSEDERPGQRSRGKSELEIEIEAEPDRLQDVVEHVRDVGATVDSYFGRLVIATANPGAVRRLADSDAIRKIDLYHEPTPDFGGNDVSEGVEISNADLLQDIGLTGQDVTIAVIDIAFNVDNDKFKDQVVGTIGGNSFFDDGDDDEDKLGLHGTATAEIVADMAPDADIVLASNRDESLGTILDELEDDDNNPWDHVDVATHSISYGMNNRIDGLDSRSDRIGDFTDGGRLFMTSSGNEANGGNWDGPFRDTNGNDLMEFDEDGTERFELQKTWDPSDDEDVTDATGSVDVHWDADWDRDDQRYEVRIYDAPTGGTELSSSQTNNPHERVDIPSGEAEEVYLEIENIDATGDEHFDIWPNGDINLSESTPERSVTIPGVSRDSNTLSVAAVQATFRGRMPNAEDLKNYSSRGPTQDGRRGVDIAAPSFVSQLDPENDGFNGTSASTPHVGGGAVLLFDPDIGASNDEIRDVLFDAGRGIADSDVNEPGPNNTEIGFGYMDTRVARDLLEGLMVHLEEKWTYDTGSRSQFMTPVVDDTEVYAGGLGDELVALSRDDGAEAWIRTRDGALSDSSAYLTNGSVYVGSGGGVLYAIDENDGTVSWTYSTGSAITSSPVVANGTVYVGANDGTVHAVDISGGAEEWTADVGEAVYADVAVANGTVFVTTRDGGIIALNAGSGSEDWRYDTETELVSSSPTVSGNTVYVAADEVVALDAASGAEKWTQTYGGTFGSDPTLDTEKDIVYVGSADGHLYAFDAATGDAQWDTEIGAGDPIASSPALADERVLVASFEGAVDLVDSFIQPGDIIDTRTLSSQTRSSPAVDNNEAYIGSEGGLIVAFEGD